MLAFSRLSTRLRSCDSHSSLTSSPAYVSHLQSDVYVQSGVFFNPNTNDGASAKTHPICNSASDYSYGVDGVNACPSGKRAIESAIACSLFAFALGGLTVTPKTTGLHGCQVTAAGAVEFNSAAGAATAGSRSVCTFVYAYGTDEINACSGGDTAISTLAECQEAADALGLAGAGTGTGTINDVTTENNNLFHKGCYTYDGSIPAETAFNTATSGADIANAVTICIAGTPSTTVTVSGFSPTTAVSGVATDFQFSGTLFISAPNGYPWIKVVPAVPGTCESAELVNTKAQLTAVTTPSETEATLSITFDTTATGTGSTANRLCWASTEAGPYQALSSPTIDVTLPLHTLTSISPSTVAVGILTTLAVGGTNFQTSGLPYIKIVPGSSGCASAALTPNSTTSGQLVAAVPASEIAATFEFRSTSVSASNTICMSATQSGTYTAVAPSLAIVTHAPTGAPTSAPSTEPSAAPTSAPSTGPSAAPTRAPSTGPSAAPTTTCSLDCLATLSSDVVVRDDGAEAVVVLTLHPERFAMAALAPSDVAVITCTVDDGSVLAIVGSGIVSIDSAGGVSPSGAAAIEVRGVADLEQHLSRSATVACTISTPSNARSHVYAALRVTTLSVNSPPSRPHAHSRRAQIRLRTSTWRAVRARRRRTAMQRSSSSAVTVRRARSHRSMQARSW